LLKLEDFILNLNWDELPEKTRQITRRCVLDALGCAVAGSRCQNLSAQVETILGQNQAGNCPIWGTDHSLQPGWAIFFNAQTAAYFDLDDGHRRAQGHPGASIIPVALTTALQLGRSGKDFLAAVVIGYEVAIRSALVMRSLGGPRKGSGGWTGVGAAAAAARLLGCSGEQVLNAIGLAEYYAPQAPQDRSVTFPSEMKEGIPWGAYTGYHSALLAAGGFSGMRPHLADASFSADLSMIYEIEKTYFKQYACCRWAHPALDGLKLMLAENRGGIENIREIRVHTFEKALLMERSNPASSMEAIYSIPYALGCFLVHGTLDPEQHSRENRQDPKIRALANRVKMLADPELTARFPEHCLQRIEVDFKPGETYRGPLLSAQGDPDKPYNENELTAKFKRLTAGILGPQGNRIPALIKELERHPLADLVTLLRPGLPAGSNHAKAT
jgi:2-methylcitrate dehydratase PrpD